jgi:hypothetical protein
VVNLVDLVADLADALDRLPVRYALGGAIATSLWGIARTTQDVDCLAAVSAVKYQELADVLEALGYKQLDAADNLVEPSVRLMREQATERKLMEFFSGPVCIDLFLPVVPLQEEVLRRAVTMPLGRREVPITTAEDMILLKLAFHRTKDLQDVRGILWVQRGRLDIEYLKHWSARSHSEDVQRELQQLIVQYAGTE